MEADGSWAGQPDGYGQGSTVQTQVDGVWIELEEPVWDEPEFTLEDGHITAVTLRVSGGCIDHIPSVWREMLMLLALSGGTENWSLLDPDLDGWLIVANAVLDRFGDSAFLAPGDDGTFTATVRVKISPIFFGWLMNFGTQAKILSPADVARQFAQAARAVAEQYDEKDPLVT